MRTVQAACRALLTDLKVGSHNWPSIAPAIQTTLNESPLERLGSVDDGVHLSPLEVMTGLRDLLQLAIPSQGDMEHMRLERIRATQLFNIRELQNASKNFTRTHIRASLRIASPDPPTQQAN